MHLKDRLMAMESHYHIHHPFHKAMHDGKLNREQLQGWVLNRFYYQVNIPLKDASILANCPEREVRRRWIKRIQDHDAVDGGIEAWLRLGEACGLSREDLLSQRHVLPGVRFAVDAYVNFAKNASWQEAACACLTELFAPTIHRDRLATWPKNYPWVDSEGLQYFRKRLKEAPEDVEHAMEFTLEHFEDNQERALQILGFKLDVLWTMLDAMHLAYVAGMPPLNLPRGRQ